MKRRASARGFTLIEVLVALAVFGVLSMMAYLSLGQTLANSDLLTERMQRLQAIQRSVSHLGSDLLQLAPRPIRVEFGAPPQPALSSSFAAEFALELTRGGWPNFAGVARSTLQRVAYRIEDGTLVRYHWNVLDRTLNNVPVETIMLDGVSSLTFRFLQEDGEWVDQWPALSAQATQPPVSGGANGDLPRAIEIVLVLENEGEITRVVEVLK